MKTALIVLLCCLAGAHAASQLSKTHRALLQSGSQSNSSQGNSSTVPLCYYEIEPTETGDVPLCLYQLPGQLPAECNEQAYVASTYVDTRQLPTGQIPGKYAYSPTAGGVCFILLSMTCRGFIADVQRPVNVAYSCTIIEAYYACTTCTYCQPVVSPANNGGVNEEYTLGDECQRPVLELFLEASKADAFELPVDPDTNSTSGGSSSNRSGGSGTTSGGSGSTSGGSGSSLGNSGTTLGNSGSTTGRGATSGAEVSGPPPSAAGLTFGRRLLAKAAGLLSQRKSGN